MGGLMEGWMNRDGWVVVWMERERWVGGEKDG